MKKKKKRLSQLSAARILPLAVSQSPPSAPRVPSSSARVSGPAVRQRGLSSSPATACSCLRRPWLPELLSFLLRELSLSLYVFNRQSLPRLSCGLQLAQLVGRPLASGPRCPSFRLAFGCGSMSTAACVAHWGSLLRRPWRTGVCPSGA